MVKKPPHGMTFRIGNQFILIAGISGSGKSSYGEHLRSMHGYHFVPTDGRIDFIEEAINSNRGLVARYLDKHRCVAVEWGFFPKYLEYVLALKEQGARLLWFFTAEEATARWAYCVKWGGDPGKLRLWEDQMERIREAHLPTSDFQIIETFRDGNFRPYEELDEECLRDS
jgi:hypothetical protein